MDFQPIRSEVQAIAVSELAGVIWREYYTPIIGEAQVEYMLSHFQSPQSILRQIQKEAFFYYLIVKEEEPCGYFSYRMQMDSLFLSKVYVLEDHRHLGIGSRVMGFLFEEARRSRFPRIELTVNRNNLGSIDFYLSMGFRNAGEVVQDIGGGFVMDDYRMVWEDRA